MSNGTCACVCFILLLLCSSSYSIEGGCNQSPTTLTEGPNKLGNFVPVLQAATDTFQPLLGGEKINGWTVLRDSGVIMHGLWCQVNPSVSFNMLNNSSNWYISTGFNTLELAQIVRSPPFPYELFQCSNQTGVVLVSGLDSFQGIVKCNTTAPNLTTPSEVYLSMYTSQVFDSYSGPSIQSTMDLNVISRRDNNVLNITFSFDVSFGLPSRVTCFNQLFQGDAQLLDARESPNLSREVLQTHYFNSSVTDITRVTVTLNDVIRRFQSFACNVTVEGYRSSPGTVITMGTAISTIIISVASAPANVNVTQVASSVIVQWSAPPQPPSFYEVFYQSQNDSQSTSGGIVSTLQITLTGLQSGVLYTFYVVGFEQNSNVFPSDRSNVVTMLLVDPPSTEVTPTSVTEVTPSVSESETTVQSTNILVPTTVTPLATQQPVEGVPITLLWSLMAAGWSLFFITLLLLVITLIVCCCTRCRHKKNSLVSATVPFKQVEEIYDNIDQLNQNNGQEMTKYSADKQDRNNSPATYSPGVQKSHNNTKSKSKAVMYDNTMEVYSKIDEVDNTKTAADRDSYVSVTNSRAHNEDDITMTECSAYGTNDQPQSDYDDTMNNKPSDQQPQNIEDDYV